MIVNEDDEWWLVHFIPKVEREKVFCNKRCVHPDDQIPLE